MRFLGEFAPAAGVVARRGETVVLRTERGIEAGEVLCPATPQAVAVIPEPTRGELLRVANSEDHAKLKQLRDLREVDYAAGTRLIAHHHLPMQLVDVEHLFGGERIVFYFLAENRVDFRELVKSLAREFHTRIEMRQIGVRDEAKLLADYGDCGKPVCCNTHMAVMPPVSMRMAKLQKSTLDPIEDLRPLRPAEVLSALRAGRLRGVSARAAAGRLARRDRQGAGARAAPGNPRPPRARRVRGRPPIAGSGR